MSVRLYLAPAASGKTQAVIQRVQEVSHQHPGGEIWVLLRDHRQVWAFRSRFGASRSYDRIQIVTFSGFYHVILEMAGQPVFALDDASIRLLIQYAIGERVAGGYLPYFASIQDTPGFTRVLVDRIAELKRALVTPEALSSQAGEGNRGLSEIATIYKDYQHKIQLPNWADPEGLSWLSIEALDRSPGLLKNCSLVAVDGFDDFTPAQRGILARIARQIPELMITFPGDQKTERRAFRRFRRASDALRSDLEPEIHQITGASRFSGQLAYLEEKIFEDAGAYPGPGEGRIVLVEASGPAGEAREALRWFKSLIRREGYLPGDCALFTQDPELYAPFLKEAAAEFALPLNVTWNVPLAAAPDVAALLNLLELPIVDYPRRETLEAVGSPFFDLSSFGLLREDAAGLEQISYYSQITGGLVQWREVFEALGTADAQIDPKLSEMDHSSYSPPDREEVLRLQAALNAWVARTACPDGKSLSGWIAWLKEYLDQVRFFELCGEDAGEAISRNVEAIISAGAISGSRPIGYAQFVASLRRLLQAASFSPQQPPPESAILAARIVEARGVRFRAVAILGLSEGIFPTVERADPFLDESTRSALGLDPHIDRLQGGLFYSALTRANERLLLTRPYLAEGGEAWVPSPYWAAVQRLFPDSVVRIKTEDFRSLDQAASPEEYLFWSVRARQPDGDFPERSGRIKHAAGILRARLGRSSQEAPLTILKKDLHAFFAGGSPWSPSRFESYGSCPYRFYTEYMLSLQPLESPQLGFDSLQQGSIVHEILEQVHRQAADPSDPKTVRSALPKVAAAVFELAPEKHGFRPSAFWEVEQQELLERVERSLDKLFGESQGWTPYRYECRFGFDPAPPLTIETPAGTIQLRGVIDRVDRAADGRLRIIDYKTGSSGLAKKDLLEGRRLQLPLYALAAQQALQLGDPSEAFYWSVNGANSYCRLSRFQSEHGNGIEAAIHLAVDYVARFLDGILNGRFSPTPPEGGCPSFCPAAAWCWRYSPGFSA